MKVNIKNTKNTMDINLQVNHKNKTRELTKVACMAALICVASFVYIPLPFTEARISLMPFMVELVGLILSPVQAGVSILVYLIIGILGLPVFAGVGGLGKILGPSGGYYWGFVPAAVAVSLCKGKKYNCVRYILVCIFVGITIMYVPGAIQMKHQLHLPWMAVLIKSVFPFIALDIVKAVAAGIIAKPIQAALHNMEE